MLALLVPLPRDALDLLLVNLSQVGEVFAAFRAASHRVAVLLLKVFQLFFKCSTLFATLKPLRLQLIDLHRFRIEDFSLADKGCI